MLHSPINPDLKRLGKTLLRWIDDDAEMVHTDLERLEKVDWLRIVPFLILHLACLGVIWVGWSWAAVVTALGLYVIRGLAITGGYHRYFSHRTYKTSRSWQLILAILGNSSVQRGPLWWAAHHRHHHRYADQPEDVHSPIRKGFWWSHILWLLTPKYFVTRKELVKNLTRYPELVFLNRFSVLVPVILLFGLIAFGELLRINVPSANTNGLQMVIWGFCISTVALFHATATINSLDHLWGSRRYQTPDQSRNNWFLAFFTFGEGWHNNHHHYPIAARNGFFWWEYDITYYVLKVLEWLGVIWDLNELSLEWRDPNRIRPLSAAKEPIHDSHEV